MTSTQAAALTRIARLCARKGDYSALGAYVESMLAAPDVRPRQQPDGTHDLPVPPVRNRRAWWRLL